MKFQTLSLIILLLLMILVLVVDQVYAHANLLRSIPEMNAVLERPPVQVELFFSEAIETEFSTIEVFDSNGKRVDNDDSEVNQAYPTRLTVSLRSMPDGVYTVSWRALSLVDSHITTGAFPFAVGEVDSDVLEAADKTNTEFKLAPGEVLARWLTYLGAMSLVGGMFFLMFVWLPAVRQMNLAENVYLPWGRIANLAILVLVVAGIIWVIVQAGQAAGQELLWPWNPDLGQLLFTTRFGSLWITRLVLAMILLWLIPKAGTGRLNWVVLAVSLFLLFTISLGSHGAAQPAPRLPIIADWVHLSAASVWIGGLIIFIASLVAMRSLDTVQSTRLTAKLIPRFSALALISVGLLWLTGLFASVLHVGSFEALTNSIYGRALLVKLIIIVPMLLLGAINLLLTKPGMEQAVLQGGSRRKLIRFHRLISAEVVLGVAVLLSVSILTTLPPIRFVPNKAKLSGFQEVDNLEISIEVVPGRPGLNQFDVMIGADQKTLNAIKEVSLQFTPVSGELPPTKTELKEIGVGLYNVEGGFLALSDAWQIQVIIRRENAYDAFTNFSFKIGDDIGLGPATGNLPFSWHQINGILLLIGGVGFILSVSYMLRNKAHSIYYSLVPGLTLMAIGILVFLKVPTDQRTMMVNPIPPNSESLVIGKELYWQNCVPCHGSTGTGDGPIGRTLNPPPADLTLHTVPGVHPDGRLFDWISNGYPDSIMPAFRDQLTDEERWHLVNYIRTMAVQ